MREVRTALIPAGGYGTRFLPASRAVPKELLPLLDRPLLHLAVEEAADAGLSRIIIVLSPGKEAIAQYFDPSPALEGLLASRGEERKLAEWKRLVERVSPVFVHQPEPLGLGHAVWTARHAVGDEPFAVLLPDDLLLWGPEPAISPLLRVARTYGGSVVAVEEVPTERISAYGAIRYRLGEEGVMEVLDLVEKPSPETAPSLWGIVGRYVLSPAVFTALEGLPSGAKGELQLTDALARLCRMEKVYALPITARRYDVGTPLGLLQASVALALRRGDTGPVLRAWLRDLLGEGEG